MIGIIGAMEIEVEDLLARMQGEHSETVSGMCFHRGQIAGVDCVLVQGGVGKVAAAMCAQTLLLRYAPQAVVFTGVAGGIGEGVHIGDLVVATALVQHDMDCTALGEEPGYLFSLGEKEMPASQRLSDLLADSAAKVYDGHVLRGVVATGDQFVSSRDKLHAIRAQFGAIACEMEGGAVAQVCRANGLPFAVLRAISDNGDEAAAVDFPTFARQAAHKTTELLLQALPRVAAAQA